MQYLKFKYYNCDVAIAGYIEHDESKFLKYDCYTANNNNFACKCVVIYLPNKVMNITCKVKPQLNIIPTHSIANYELIVASYNY